MATQLEIKDKTEATETIKILPFRKEVKKTIPHKHNNYFEIIYLSGGSGYHSIDSPKYPVIPPIIYHFLGLLRAVAQVLSFLACVWAMTKVFKIEKHKE
jgi:hypothetical protein